MAGRKRRSDMDIFFSHVTPGRMDDCWIWQGGKRGDYGAGRLNGKTEDAHRVSYQLFVGEIPDGLEVMHGCNTPLCVNPAHLSLGTHAENMAQTAGRRQSMSPARGSRHGLSKLTEADVVAIWGYRKSELSHREIGKMFGVSGTNITVILNRKMWQHVTDNLPD